MAVNGFGSTVRTVPCRLSRVARRTPDRASVRHAIIAMSIVAATASPASAQDADATYRTLIALIDEMVENKLISRARADALIARAQAKAQAARPETPLAVAAAPERTVAPTQNPSPLRQAPAEVASTDPRRLGAMASPTKAPLAKPADLAVDWSRSVPVFASADGRFTFRIRGRLLADVSTTDGSRFDARNLTVASLRQFRLGAAGTIGDHLFYQLETDFRRNAVEVTQALLGYKTRFGKVDVDVRAGSLLSDRGVDVATPANTNPFITLNVNSLALAPQGRIFITGIAARAGQRNWHTSLALHGDAVDGDFTRNENRTLLGRTHWTPYLSNGDFVHLGGWAYDERSPASELASPVVQPIAGALNGSVRVEVAPLLRVAGSRAFGLELGGGIGSLYGFAEYGERAVRGRADATFDTARLNALSVSGGWWLTGEKPAYVASAGILGVPKLRKSLLDGGWGGVEMVARYERADSRGAPSGGIGTAATAGVNWWLVPNVRLMLNATRWTVDNRVGALRGDDEGTTVTARAELSF